MKWLFLSTALLAACGDESPLQGDVFSSPRWALTLGSSGADGAGSVVFTGDGDVVVGGAFSGTVDFGNTVLAAAEYAGFVSKRSGVDGAERWTIAIGGAPTRAGVTDVAVAPNGSLIVVGYYEGELRLGNTVLQGESPCFLSELNADGQVVWARSIAATVATNCSGLAVGSDGRIAVTGFYLGSISLPSGTYESRDYDTFLMTFDNIGSVLWGTTVPNVGGTVGVQGLGATGLAVDAAGDIILAGGVSGPVTLAGTSLTPLSRNSRFVARFAPTGELRSAEVLGPTGVTHSPGPILSTVDGAMAFVSTRSPNDGVGQGAPTLTMFDEAGGRAWETAAASKGAAAMAITVLDDGTVVTGGILAGYSMDPGSGTLHGCLYLLAYASTSELRDAASLILADPCPSIGMRDLAAGPSAFAFVGSVDASVDVGTGVLRHAGLSDALIEVFDSPPQGYP